MILEFNAPGWRAQLASIMIEIDGYVADSAHHAIVGFDYLRQLPPGETHEESDRTRLAGP